MIKRIITASILVCCSVAGTAQAALEGRDLNGSIDNFEAYYDTVLDITWLADANRGAGSSYDDGYSTTDGRMSWANAVAWATNLSFTDGVNVYDNWRLPTIDPSNGVSFNYTWAHDGSTDIGYNITSPNNEMAYMYHVNLGNLGNRTLAGEIRGCWVSASDTCLDNTDPFSNIEQPYAYWSGLEYAPNSDYAWMFDMRDGGTGWNGKGAIFNAWAVSPGDVGIAATIPEPEAYAMFLAGLGLVGFMAQRRKHARIQHQQERAIE